MSDIKVGLQLYTVRDAAQEDFFGVLAQVKAMGYDYVEFTADFFGKSAEEVRAELDRLGLKAVCSHVPLELFREDTAAAIARFRTLGCTYLAVPWLAPELRPGTPAWPGVVEDVKNIAKACKDAGVTLLYHNHDFEFVKIDGEYALDRLFADIPADLLQTEIDTCWVKFSGVDPADYVRSYAGRAPIVHLKDFVRVEEGGAHGMSLELRPLGMGCQDVASLLAAAEAAGAEYVIVEQDFSPGRPSVEAAQISRECLRKLGY